MKLLEALTISPLVHAEGPEVQRIKSWTGMNLPLINVWQHLARSSLLFTIQPSEVIKSLVDTFP